MSDVSIKIQPRDNKGYPDEKGNPVPLFVQYIGKIIPSGSFRTARTKTDTAFSELHSDTISHEK